MSDALQLDVQAVACVVHAEPFHAQWPAGWLPFALYLMQHALGDAPQEGDFARVLKAAHDRGQPLEQSLAALLPEYGPLCHIAKPETLLAAYSAADEMSDVFGRAVACTNCRRVAERGAPFRFNNAHGGPAVQRRLCFKCVAGLPHQSAGEAQMRRPA